MALVLAMVQVLLVGCGIGDTQSELPGPAKAVDDLLTARSMNVTDVAYYERLVESSAVAQALAADSAARPATQSAIPLWKTPRVTKETTSAAQVTVDWTLTKGFETWPAWTQFGLTKTRGAWLVVEAADSTMPVNAAPAP